MSPRDADHRSLTLTQSLLVYAGVLVTLVAGLLPLHIWVGIRIRPAAALLLGALALWAASRRPWWLFYVVRHTKAFARLDEALVQRLCLVIGGILVVAGLVWRH